MKFFKCKSSASVFGKFRSNVSEIRTVRPYFDLYKDDATSITDAQYNDLDIENLFNFSNRCLTPIGEMLLYHKFRHLFKKLYKFVSDFLLLQIFEPVLSFEEGA